LGEVFTHLVAGYTDGGQVLTAKTRQAGSRHESHENGSDGALEQTIKPAAPLVIQPGHEASFAVAEGLGELGLQLARRFCGDRRHGDAGIALHHLGHGKGRAERGHLIEKLSGAFAVDL
jgi:hypothetical protein